MELIIGSSNQLDVNNKRYIVKVYITNAVGEKLGFELYRQDSNDIRSQVVPDRKVSAVNNQLVGYPIEANEYIVPAIEESEQYYLGIRSVADEHPNLKAEVYDFWNFIIYLQMGVDIKNIPSITDTVLNQDMTMPGAGLKINYDTANMFAIVYYTSDNNISSMSFVSFAAVSDSSYIDAGLYNKEAEEFVDVVCLNADHIGFNDVDSVLSANGVHEICLMLNDGYSANNDLYCVLDAHGKTYGDQANSYVSKAVVGHYDSLEDAVGCEDIKNQLIPSDKTSSARGYKGNYNYENGGMNFTVFFEDGSIYKLTVLAMDYTPKFDENYFRSFTEDPIIGEADPWFRVNSATDSQGKVYSSENSNAYVVENGKNINMDTYYGYGYQTIFINDENADLSKLKPTFGFADENRLYAVSKDTGNKVEEGHIRNFEKENQQYTLVFDNNTDNERNYWITFKKLNNDGPELYVYGPREREVILDDYFEYKHDILIANIGNGPLEDISVELVEAENVKLDSYWTVGGEGNETLAPFTTTSTDKEYGELPNMAKIRLLPDGDGEVKGTLIIRAKDQDPVMITLNGAAQTPEIVTESLSDAVKYVPYQYIIATNNIHDWIKTEFSVVDGELPEGITLNKDTGELYGVPTVPDGDNEVIYKFTIEAKYSVEGEVGYFDSAYKEFKLKVKPNTNDNVYNASDEGYKIKEHIGTETENSHEFVLENIEEDQLFVSNGNYGEFIDLWLNGEKLYYNENDLDNSDYTKEEGSTRITIKSETFENKASKDKPNTIAMEFRNDDNEVNRTAQNFNIKNTPSVDVSVENVISLINAIPSNVTLSDRGKVQTARNAYNALSTTQKKSVTNYSKLTDAESVISKLETDEANKAAANKVVALINSLPNVISISDKTAVESARSAYDDLSPSQKNYVSNYNKLLAAEDAIKTLEKNRLAAQPVINLINDIPTSITLNSKDAIVAARNAYNKLTSEQKQYVTNYSKLTAAEEAIATLEAEEQERAKNKAAAQPVVDKIDKIPYPVTLESKDIITAARKEYNLLTSAQKGYVTNYSRLTAAEDEISRLEAEKRAEEASKAAINAVIAKINKLTNDLKLSDKNVVEEARQAYEALTPVQKNDVINYGDLVKAEKTIAALEALEKANEEDKVSANKVIELIDSISNEITLDDKAEIESIRNAYDKLTGNQKQMVTNYDELISAESLIATLEAYEAAVKKDKEAADKVIALIASLPTEITISDKDMIEQVRHAYDSLTDSQKEIVTNYDVLVNSETALAEKELEEYEKNKDEKTVTIVLSAIDKNGKALVDYIIEIHSDIQQSRTDENGFARFSNVKMGNHTLTIKNADGTRCAEKTFKITEGNLLSLNNDEIIAEAGSTFTLAVKVDNENISFLSVKSGDQAPELKNDDDKEHSIDISDSTKDEKNIDDIKIDISDSANGGTSANTSSGSVATGDRNTMYAWYVLLVCSWTTLVVMFVHNRRKRKR